MDKALSPTQTPHAALAGEWPLAVESGDAARVQSLLASGAAVDATFDRGETALMRASARGYADVARVLLEAGADVNARRDDGFTPLILAVFFGQEDVVRLLLEAGADTSARTALGTTAAKWAASRGFKEIAELLKEAEASRPARAREPEERPRAATGEVRPVPTSTFKLRELPSEPPDPPDERRASTVGHEDLKGRADEHQDLKTRMEAIVAASPVGAVRDHGAATADMRGDDSFINNEAVEGATVESPRSEEFTTRTPFAPDESASKTARKDSPAPSGSRFRSVLQSWPVTAGALILIVASVASVFLLQGSSETSATRPATAGEAPQPVVPQTPAQAAETLPQPSPSVTPEVAQPLPAPPGTYDSFPFTTNPQEVTTSSGPPQTTGAASNVPAVVSESDIGGGGRPTESEETRGRATPRETRGASPAAAAPREAREGEGVDEGAARETPPRNPPPRTGVETRRTTAGAPPPSTGNTPPPAPTPAERRKVIPWP